MHGRALGVEKRTCRRGDPERRPCPPPNAGFRVLAADIAVRASVIDVVRASGRGVPRYRGAPMFRAESVGSKKLLVGILKYPDRFDARYRAPAPRLVARVAAGSTLAQLQAAARRRADMIVARVEKRRMFDNRSRSRNVPASKLVVHA